MNNKPNFRIFSFILKTCLRGGHHLRYRTCTAELFTLAMFSVYAWRQLLSHNRPTLSIIPLFYEVDVRVAQPFRAIGEEFIGAVWRAISDATSPVTPQTKHIKSCGVTRGLARSEWRVWGGRGSRWCGMSRVTSTRDMPFRLGLSRIFFLWCVFFVGDKASKLAINWLE